MRTQNRVVVSKGTQGDSIARKTRGNKAFHHLTCASLTERQIDSGAAKRIRVSIDDERSLRMGMEPFHQGHEGSLVKLRGGTAEGKGDGKERRTILRFRCGLWSRLARLGGERLARRSRTWRRHGGR